MSSGGLPVRSALLLKGCKQRSDFVPLIQNGVINTGPRKHGDDVSEGFLALQSTCFALNFTVASCVCTRSAK